LGREKGHIVTQETRDLISLHKKGQKPWNTGLHGVQVSWNLGKHHTKVTRMKISDAAKKQWSNPDARIRDSEMQRKLWSDPAYAKRVLTRRIPSYPEQVFMDLSKEFRYVGNGQLVINGKNPDFVCINDEHKLVEIWGDHWHKGQDPQCRIDFFKVLGYDCLVIWASELRHSGLVVSKVKKFLGED